MAIATRKTLIKRRPIAEPVGKTEQDYIDEARTGGLYFTSEKSNLRFIPSGSTLLDLVLGGGWARGRMSNVVGDKSTGKTLLAIEATAQSLKMYPGEEVDYKECESAFDEEYATQGLGVDMSRVNLDPKIGWTVEDFMKDVDEMLARKKPPALYIVDSLDALSDDAEKVRKIGEETYGMQKAKLLHQFFRERGSLLNAAGVHLMIISQVKDNINAGKFGKKHTRSGGKSLDFWASQIIWLAFMGEIQKEYLKQKRTVGVKIRAKNEKNKVGLPYRDCDFEITFGFGIEDVKSCRAFLKDTGADVPAGIDDAALRALVRQQWMKIEEHFLPTERKYGWEIE